MPRISSKKEDKIKESILLFLFQSSPKPIFTAHISQELARDEEYIKKLLQDLETRKLVLPVKKNQEGLDYKKRMRWRLSDRAYVLYKQMQPNQLSQQSSQNLFTLK
jgi:hypothetical protein